jgi:septal ring factor EnvC (AmiA/AmiB activator)
LNQISNNLDKIGEKLKGSNDGSGGIKVDEMEAELNQARLKIRELEDQIKNIGQEVDKVNKDIEDIGDLPDKIKDEQIKVENKVQNISVKVLAIVGVFALTY